jgi:hypothetical protein
MNGLYDRLKIEMRNEMNDKLEQLRNELKADEPDDETIKADDEVKSDDEAKPDDEVKSKYVMKADG